MNDERRPHNGFAFILGLIFGALIGGGLGLLLAPSEGEETRKKLKEKGKDLKEKAAGLCENFAEVCRPVLNTMGDSVPEGPEDLPFVPMPTPESAPSGSHLDESTKESLPVAVPFVSPSKKRFFKHTRR